MVSDELEIKLKERIVQLEGNASENFLNNSDYEILDWLTDDEGWEYQTILVLLRDMDAPENFNPHPDYIQYFKRGGSKKCR